MVSCSPTEQRSLLQFLPSLQIAPQMRRGSVSEKPTTRTCGRQPDGKAFILSIVSECTTTRPECCGREQQFDVWRYADINAITGLIIGTHRHCNRGWLVFGHMPGGLGGSA